MLRVTALTSEPVPARFSIVRRLNAPTVTVSVAGLMTEPLTPVTIHVFLMVGVTTLAAKTPPEAGAMLKVVLPVTLPIGLPKVSVAMAVYDMPARH